MNKEKLILFLNTVGFSDIPHVKQKSLTDHLVRTADILYDWGCEDEVVYAGALHSAYSTEYFQNSKPLHRDLVREQFGQEVETLVNLFCTSKRFSQREKNGTYVITNRFLEKEEEISLSEYRAMLIITIANELDHIDMHNQTSIISRLNVLIAQGSNYQLLPILCKEYISFFYNPHMADVKDARSFVRYIGHAGVQVACGNESLVIDPWLYSSTLLKPIVDGFEHTQKTIDFMIPGPKNSIEDILSKYILISHWHVHHSPYNEIKEMLQRLDKVTIICPPLDEAGINMNKKRLGEYLFNKIEFIFILEDQEIKVGPYTIFAFQHTKRRHVGFMVSTPDVKIVHITDARANKDTTRNSLDDLWFKLQDSHPDFMFISASRHFRKDIQGLVRSIVPDETFTAIQATELATIIKPKSISLIGKGNFSIWDSYVESSLQLEIAYKELMWCIAFLYPAASVRMISPGDILSVY